MVFRVGNNNDFGKGNNVSKRFSVSRKSNVNINLLPKKINKVGLRYQRRIYLHKHLSKTINIIKHQTNNHIE